MASGFGSKNLQSMSIDLQDEFVPSGIVQKNPKGADIRT